MQHPHEPIQVVELPLPPVAPSDMPGACSKAINPHETGCIGQTGELRNGNFLPGNKHIVATVNFTGAPACPHPACIYSGVQLIVISVDGRVFPSGDPWKCITCGVSAANRNGSTELLEYPQSFKDGKRVLAGSNIIECDALLSSPQCTPEATHIYPIRWQTTSNNTGFGGAIRELRIHPDNVHLGFSSFTTTPSGDMGQFAYFSRLRFDPNPKSGLPLVARYDLDKVTRLYDPTAAHPITVSGQNMTINRNAISIGELRGFSGQGTEITYVGTNWESSNFDLFAVHMQSGRVRRITQHPGYTDPIDISPDDQWSVILDTRSTNRTMFIAGMRHIPPLTDLVASTATASIRNNGQRRFFQPWILDRRGDRGGYVGQQVNAAGDGTPGSINDPEWNAQADPRWSWDGTKIAYYQTLTVPPQCGGLNPLPCPVSTAQGGRTYRIMLATLTSRKPASLNPVAPVADTIPWGTPYIPGDQAPAVRYPPAGRYTLTGSISGHASVELIENHNRTSLETVSVTYYNYSDEPGVVLRGYENVTTSPLSLTSQVVHWHSDLRDVGVANSSKITGPGGFHIAIDVLETLFEANGTLTTTVGGVVYVQPENYT
ncbi:hypothetical protein BJY04DRAFT_210627 [Aspergillus karnatakaensis]|uniref:uncharacterized protein n=1 Tax=Aspergillus karnatakaensis TaxID=1810916 RepID=UPI003CCDF6F2